MKKVSYETISKKERVLLIVEQIRELYEATKDNEPLFIVTIQLTKSGEKVYYIAGASQYYVG